MSASAAASAGLAERFREDGCVFVRGALDAAALRAAEEAWAWSLAHPSPRASRFEGAEGTFYQDLANPKARPVYEALLRDSPAPDLAAALWQASDVWFLYEQVFLKEGGETRRTPWHQDSSYLPIAGDQLAVFWIPFEPVREADSLEMIPGSHRGPLYDGSAFDPEDDTAPLYGDGRLPRLPDIEAERERWRIVSHATEPGDLVAFHPSVLHGGACTHRGERRRTLSLRFYGADVTYAPRADGIARIVGEREDEGFVFDALAAQLAPGEPLRHPGFPKLR